MQGFLREHFGFGTFREGQERVIAALMEDRPVLAVFPTGGGKSLCYQLPALALDGVTLVVSPLIALMKDQVDGLKARGIAAARLDSTLGAGEVAEVFGKLEAEELKLLYVAPERLSNEGFRKRLKGRKIALLAIDEAHCISEWGHNFRPDYLKLAKVARELKVRRVLALTATATPKVAREIRKCFKIAAGDEVRLSFHRRNLDLRVTPCAAAEKKDLLLERLGAAEGAAVVYVTRQETAEEVATFLAKRGLAARAYHAGLPDDCRSEVQRAFMAGETEVVVATIAFGMGIDKADIRRVIHYNPPKSLENYAQEIGRAGRDGEEAVCEWFACGDDLTVLENFIHADLPSAAALANLLGRVLRLGEEFDVSIYDLSVACDIRPTVIETVLAYLEMDGVIVAKGSFYPVWKVRMPGTVDGVLAGRPAAERRFLAKVLECGAKGRVWLEFGIDEVAEKLGVTRKKITDALSDLEASGEAALKLSGVRKTYRRGKRAGDARELTGRMTDFFQRRGEADLERLRQVLGLAGHRGCLTAYLTKHFGETLPGACGHCDRCRGVPAKAVGRGKRRRISDEEWECVRRLRKEGHAALGSPRQLARFLCGMSSPAATRARLYRHEACGMLADLPFAEVLAVTEAGGR